MQLSLRAIADCATQEVAENIAARLALSLSSFSPEITAMPKPYRKTSGEFVFMYDLYPATESSFQAVVSASSGGWHHIEVGEEPSSVWNRMNDHSFWSPEVRWAEIQLYEPAA